MGAGEGEPPWVRVPVEGKENSAYYWNAGTHAVCWDLPAGGEVLWTAQKTADGRVYYWHSKTRETTWFLPSKATGTSFRLNSTTAPPETGWQFTAVSKSNPPKASTNPEKQEEAVWVEVPRGGKAAYYWDFRGGVAAEVLPQGASVSLRGCKDGEGRWYFAGNGESTWAAPGMPQPAPPAEGWFEIGAAVRLRGLRTTRYNEQLGQVWGYQDGRVAVVLPDCLGGTILAVRPCHVAPLPKAAIVELRDLSIEALNGEVGTVEGAEDTRYTVKLRDGTFKAVRPTKLFARARLWDLDVSRAPTWLQWRKEQDCLFIDSAGQHRRYSLHLPLGFSEGHTRAWPVLVYLHGMGGRSFFTHSKRSLKSTGLQHAAHNFVVVSPHCQWIWREQPKPWVTELVMALTAADWVDTHRIYLTGCSMGGMGTWELAAARPELYAAIAPVAGHHQAEREAFIASKLQTMPIFAVHSEEDDTCPFHLEESLWRLLLDTEGNSQLQVNVAPHVGHCSMFERAYCDETTLYDWLMHYQR